MKITRYIVLTVYEDNDGFQPLVQCLASFPTARAAMAYATKYATHVARYEAYKEFDSVWEKVDNGEKDWNFRDWGYDPTEEHHVCIGIRVAKVEEEINDK